MNYETLGSALASRQPSDFGPLKRGSGQGYYRFNFDQSTRARRFAVVDCGELGLTKYKKREMTRHQSKKGTVVTTSYCVPPDKSIDSKGKPCSYPRMYLSQLISAGSPVVCYFWIAASTILSNVTISDLAKWPLPDQRTTGLPGSGSGPESMGGDGSTGSSATGSDSIVDLAWSYPSEYVESYLCSKRFHPCDYDLESWNTADAAMECDEIQECKAACAEFLIHHVRDLSGRSDDGFSPKEDVFAISDVWARVLAQLGAPHLPELDSDAVSLVWLRCLGFNKPVYNLEHATYVCFEAFRYDSTAESVSYDTLRTGLAVVMDERLADAISICLSIRGDAPDEFLDRCWTPPCMHSYLTDAADGVLINHHDTDGRSAGAHSKTVQHVGVKNVDGTKQESKPKITPVPFEDDEWTPKLFARRVYTWAMVELQKDAKRVVYVHVSGEDGLCHALDEGIDLEVAGLSRNNTFGFAFSTSILRFPTSGLKLQLDAYLDAARVTAQRLNRQEVIPKAEDADTDFDRLCAAVSARVLQCCYDRSLDNYLSEFSCFLYAVSRAVSHTAPESPAVLAIVGTERNSFDCYAGELPLIPVDDSCAAVTHCRAPLGFFPTAPLTSHVSFSFHSRLSFLGACRTRTDMDTSQASTVTSDSSAFRAIYNSSALILGLVDFANETVKGLLRCRVVDGGGSKIKNFARADELADWHATDRNCRRQAPKFSENGFFDNQKGPDDILPEMIVYAFVQRQSLFNTLENASKIGVLFIGSEQHPFHYVLSYKDPPRNSPRHLRYNHPPICDTSCSARTRVIHSNNGHIHGS